MFLFFHCLILTFISLSFSSCSSRWDNYQSYYDPGKVKPRVVVIPVMDACDHFQGGWNLGRELTLEIRENLLRNSGVYVLDKDRLNTLLSSMSVWDLCHFDRLERDIWPYFARADFAVLLEVQEHQCSPFEQAKINPHDSKETYPYGWILTIKVRMVILDVRMNRPQVILDEIIGSTHTIPPGEECTNYQSDCWGTLEYAKSPFYICHEKISKNIAYRIEDVTRSANSEW